MKTERTKSLQKIYGWLTFFHIVCFLGPLLTFIIIGYASGTSTQKVTLSLTLAISIILALISLVISATHRAGLHRTIMWIIIIGILACLKSIESCIWTLAITSIIDELILIPARNKYKELVTINKEMDKRE